MATRRRIRDENKGWGLLAALTVAIVMIAMAAGASAATKSAVIDVKSVTGVPVPVSFTMNQIREAIGVDFAANWDSLRVEDSAGNLIPFQLDDVDLSGSVSRVDELAFLAAGPVKIVVSDESPSQSRLSMQPLRWSLRRRAGSLSGPGWAANRKQVCHRGPDQFQRCGA